MTIELKNATAEKVYQAVSFLPTAERIKLAGLLITGVSPRDIVDTGEVWSDEDLSDFSDASFALSDEPTEDIQDATG